MSGTDRQKGRKQRVSSGAERDAETMVDPTSDIGEDVDEESAPECTVCGSPIVQEPTHRVVTWVDEDGQIQHRDFCGEECRAAWDEQN